MKTMRKDKLQDENDMILIKNERDILSKIAIKRMPQLSHEIYRPNTLQPHFLNYMLFNFETIDRIFFVTKFF